MDTPTIATDASNSMIITPNSIDSEDKNNRSESEPPPSKKFVHENETGGVIGGIFFFFFFFTVIIMHHFIIVLTLPKLKSLFRLFQKAKGICQNIMDIQEEEQSRTGIEPAASGNELRSRCHLTIGLASSLKEICSRE